MLKYKKRNFVFPERLSTGKVYTYLLLMLIFSPVSAQDWARTNIHDLQRVDIRDLGYPGVNEIPENSSAITSLITAHDGLIYGATTGDESWFFLFDPAINKVRHLGRIPGQESVHHSLAEDKQGIFTWVPEGICSGK